ncbi:MAG TPA: GAF domain-containing protein [Stellaceae bacterium]|nr:GAF domain-containing protein [Stellaceae bacterium]
MKGRGSIPLEQVIITAELGARPSRPPDYETESRTLAQLMAALAHKPSVDGVLQSLVESALDLCRAHSAGVSVLEKDGKGDEVFCWRAAAGRWSFRRGDVVRRDSPSGTVLDANEPMLMAHPERHYGNGHAGALPVAEALFVPIAFKGKAVGTLWIALHEKTREFDREDLRLMTSLGRFAGNAYQLLEQELLTAELHAAQRLQEVSTELLGENNIETLYQKIVDAAVAIMRSNFASMQMYYPERGPRGELKLLAHRGFSDDAARAWTWVRPSATTTCGVSLQRGERVIAADVESCDFMAGTRDLEVCLGTGIRAAQSTPLVSRDGQLLGMISTHWARPHSPTERDLRFFDVLARQAADLIERTIAADRTRALLRELSHRAKNILTVVQAIAHQTAHDADPTAFADEFSARLAGLAATQDLLVQSDWRGVELSELMRSHLRFLGELMGGGRITCDGPALRLAPAAAQTIGMALHELMTNAVKFGALSNSDGTVAVTWRISPDGVDPRFLMTWRERDGPGVRPPGRRGFGHTATVRSVEFAFDAKVSLDYAAEGVIWTVDAPAAAVLDEGTGSARSQPEAGFR